MKTAVMQPYFLPYLGYFQLLAAVDIFVILDDVNYINRGWINRNRILLNGQPCWVTLPISKASQNRRINEISLDTNKRFTSKTLDRIRHAYTRAPHFSEVMPLIEDIFRHGEKNLCFFLLNSFILSILFFK